MNLQKFGYIIPVFETLIGIALLFPASRKWGVVSAMMTHFIILLYLGPFGIQHNSIVYPWNLAMIVIVPIVFFKNQAPLDLSSFKMLHWLAAALVWVMPLFSFIDLWDHYLSFSFYSGRPQEHYISIETVESEKLGDIYKSYYIDLEGLTGGYVIDINKWAMKEMNVPFYPEKRVFEKLSLYFCQYEIENDKLIFLVFEQPHQKMEFLSFKCSNLANN